MAETRKTKIERTDRRGRPSAEIQELSKRESEKIQGGVHFRIYELPPVKFGLKDDYNGSENPMNSTFMLR